MDLEPGDRVRVVGHPEWPEGTVGTIAEPLPEVVELRPPGELSGCRRTRFWVEFDRPVDDGSGDGPYRGGEVEDEYLRLIRRASPPTPPRR